MKPLVEWILKPDRPVSQGAAILILVLNILPFPGLGTIVYGRVVRGILELLTTIILIGVIFSILDGLQILTKATKGTRVLKPSGKSGSLPQR